MLFAAIGLVGCSGPVEAPLPAPGSTTETTRYHGPSAAEEREAKARRDRAAKRAAAEAKELRETCDRLMKYDPEFAVDCYPQDVPDAYEEQYGDLPDYPEPEPEYPEPEYPEPRP